MSGAHVLHARTVEQIFKFDAILERMRRAKERLNLRRIIFAELGKNMLAYFNAAQSLGLKPIAIADNRLAATKTAGETTDYRGIPILRWQDVDTSNHPGNAVILTTMSRVHAPARTAALRRTLSLPIIDLFSRQDAVLHGPNAPTAALTGS